MKVLFVIAMDKEAKEIVNHYKLEKKDDNYYNKGDISLLVTDITRNGITKSLVDLIYKRSIKLDEYVIINVGMVGSNNLKIGDVVMVDKSFGYNFDLTPFNDPLYYAPSSPYTLDTIKGVKLINCYTSDGFVLNTDITCDAIFDMELNAIVNFPNKKLYSIKVVSDSLNNKTYESFKFNDYLEKVYEIVKKITE